MLELENGFQIDVLGGVTLADQFVEVHGDELVPADDEAVLEIVSTELAGA